MDDRRKDDDRIFDLIRTTSETKASMEYIKETLKEIKEDLTALKNTNKCSDCEVKHELEKHLETHDKGLSRKITVAGILVSSILSVITILLSALKVI